MFSGSLHPATLAPFLLDLGSFLHLRSGDGGWAFQGDPVCPLIEWMISSAKLWVVDFPGITLLYPAALFLPVRPLSMGCGHWSLILQGGAVPPTLGEQGGVALPCMWQLRTSLSGAKSRSCCGPASNHLSTESLPLPKWYSGSKFLG